jgi:hypothetical protein
VSTSGVNPFEQAARDRKVAKLVLTVDRVAGFAGLDPATDGFAIADMLESLPRSRWLDIAAEAQVSEPSRKHTIPLVVEHYRERGAIAQSRAQGAA